ncbi:MAG TPA: hypothetical protein VGF94_13415 [Kofleriaceae bacterium]
MTTAELERIASAVQTQLDRDVLPSYREFLQMNLRNHPHHAAVREGVHVTCDSSARGWVVSLDPRRIKASELPSAIGTHGSDRGVPWAEVNPEKCRVEPFHREQFDRLLSMYISHEVIETLLNPLCNIAIRSPFDGRSYAFEPCDPVRAAYYPIDGVMVSDFVLPFWFGEKRELAPYDIMGILKEPFTFYLGGCMKVNGRNTGIVTVPPGQTSGSAHPLSLEERALRARKDGTVREVLGEVTRQEDLARDLSRQNALAWIERGRSWELAKVFAGITAKKKSAPSWIERALGFGPPK